MPIKTYEITDIAEIAKIGATRDGWWFRGHSRLFGELTPSIFRKDVVKRLSLSSHSEAKACTLFRQNAPALGKVPDDRDYLGWLVLMQHYGCPTRLLDWTESALIAFYFAVYLDFRHDGEVWAFDPTALNRHNTDLAANKRKPSQGGMPVIGRDRRLGFLAEEAFFPTQRDTIRRRYELLEFVNYPIPFHPTRSWERMTAQLSTFTIHPLPAPGFTIPELVDLIRYKIPAKRKKSLRDEIRRLGVSEMRLFPDLEGLSKWIRGELANRSHSPKAPAIGNPLD